MGDELRSADVMKQQLLANIDQLRGADAAQVVTQAADAAKGSVPAYRSDPWVYRMVVLFLGLSLLAVIACAAADSIYKVNLPEGLVAIGAAAVGALAGLLAPSPTSR